METAVRRPFLGTVHRFSKSLVHDQSVISGTVEPQLLSVIEGSTPEDS